MMTVSETTQVIDHVANKLQVPTKELMSTLPQLGIHGLSLTVISAVVLLSLELHQDKKLQNKHIRKLSSLL